MTQLDERGSWVKVPKLYPKTKKKKKRGLRRQWTSHQEVSVNECAVCCGLYEDDIDEGGNIISEWVYTVYKHSLCFMEPHTDGDYVCLTKHSRMYKN